MKKTVLILICILTAVFLSGCQSTQSTRKGDTSGTTVLPDEMEMETEKLESDTLNVIIGNITYTADYYDNATAEAFKDHLPFEAQMQKGSDSESYVILDYDLPTSDEQTGEIHAGDLVLDEDNRLILFDADSTSDKPLSPIAKIQDPKGLEEQLQNSPVQVKFN